MVIYNKLPIIDLFQLWMGTHVKGQSRVGSGKNKGKSLRDYFIDHPRLLGDGVYKTYGVQLPFLFKVLSVNKSLSIQAHPTKEHASILHSQYPERYPDPNHKPELAIGLYNRCYFSIFAKAKRQIQWREHERSSHNRLTYSLNLIKIYHVVRLM